MNKEFSSNEDVGDLVLNNVSKEYLRKIILGYGAHVCGFADIKRFEDAPKGFHPCDIYSECKSVVAFGVSLPKGLYMVDSRLIYGHFNDDVCNRVDEIAYKIALLMESSYGGIAVPIPADGPYEFWDANRLDRRGLLSMKHVAVQAGLGTLGKNTLFLNESYGNRLTLGCVLTNIVVDSDSYAEPLCLPNCNACVTNCSSGALHEGSVSQRECRMKAYGKTRRGFDTVDCNRCRTVCPMRFGACVV